MGDAYPPITDFVYFKPIKERIMSNMVIYGKVDMVARRGLSRTMTTLESKMNNFVDYIRDYDVESYMLLNDEGQAGARSCLNYCSFWDLKTHEFIINSGLWKIYLKRL
ncbi:MAG: hypothetical protein NKF70_12885 [Methanobacterium sp. ERen5]|nr:MAG: hypothetical protein NKF70_12885 [Methanobacterium sp. ERen5]